MVSAATGWPQSPEAAPDRWWASKGYYAELGKRCPQKHLDLLAFGELPDVMDAFSKQLSKADLERIRKAEAERCGDDSIGASCANEGFLRVVTQQNRLGDFATFVCALPKHCTAQSECKQD